MNRYSRSACMLALVLSVAVPVAAQAQADCCIAPDNGIGTATLPPASTAGGCVYAGATEIVDGLPAGTTIQITGWFGNFFNVAETAGGGLGGTTSTWQGQFQMQMTGTGTLLGFSRSIVVPLGPGNNIIEWAPRMNAAPLQTGMSQVYFLSGQITGDPDFDLLRITAGNGFGLPSPGQYQVASTFGGWGVSGYFDLTHRIDFIGRPGGALSGMSGSTSRQRRFEMCPGGAVGTESSTWSNLKALYR